MKYCSKCNKQYDDSWKVCLNCGDVLATQGLTQEDMRGLDVDQEIKKTQKQIKALNVKLQSLEDYKTSPENRAQEKTITQAVENKSKKENSKTIEQKIGQNVAAFLGVIAIVFSVSLIASVTFANISFLGKIGIGYLIGIGLLISGAYLRDQNKFINYSGIIISGGWATVYLVTNILANYLNLESVWGGAFVFLALLFIGVFSFIHSAFCNENKMILFSYALIGFSCFLAPITIFTLLSMIVMSFSVVFLVYKNKNFESMFYGQCIVFVLFFFFINKIDDLYNLNLMLFSSFTCWMILNIPVLKNIIPDKKAELGFSAINVVMLPLLFSALLEKPDFVFLKGPIFSFLAVIYLIFSLFMHANKRENLEKIFAVGSFVCAYIAFFSISVLFVPIFNSFIALTIMWFILAHILLYVAFKRNNVFYSGLSAIAMTLAFCFSIEGLMYTKAFNLGFFSLLLAQECFLVGVLAKDIVWRVLGKGLLALSTLSILGSISSSLIFFPNNQCFYIFSFLLFAPNYFLSSFPTRNIGILENKIKIQLKDIFLYLIGFVLMFWVWHDSINILVGPLWLVMGCMIFVIGKKKNNIHLNIIAHYLAIMAFIRLFMVNFSLFGGVLGVNYKVLTCFPTIFLFTYLKQEMQIAADTDIWKKRLEKTYSVCIFLLIIFMIRSAFPLLWVGPLWAITAIIYFYKGLLKYNVQSIYFSFIVALFAFMRVAFFNMYTVGRMSFSVLYLIFPLFTIALFYYASFWGTKNMEDFKAHKKVYGLINKANFVFSGGASLLVMWAFISFLERSVVVSAVYAQSLVLLVIGFVKKEKNIRFWGLLLIIGVTLWLFLKNMSKLTFVDYMGLLLVGGIILVGVSYVYTKYIGQGSQGEKHEKE